MFDIDSAIKDGLMYIADGQQMDGGFSSRSSFDQKDFTGAISHSTTFFSSAILTCLNGVAEHQKYRPLADPIRTRAAAFLLGERSKGWSFNYWTRDAKERETSPFPDDLDDTFSALLAIAQYDPTIIDGEVLAAIATILTQTETREGGPYHTWLVAAPDGPWADVDLAVNSTVGYFLDHVGIRLPNLEALIDGAFIDGNIRSPYYPSAAHVLYFISRFYKSIKNNGAVQRAVAAIFDFRKRGITTMTPLENALTITALINCGAAKEIAPGEVERLLEKIEKGKWKPYAFCIDPARDGVTMYAGASSLTAALYIETLALYKNAYIGRNNDGGDENSEKRKMDDLHRKIIACAKNDIRHTGLRTRLHAIAAQKIDTITDHKITLLAHEFKAALGARGAAIRQEKVEQLALGNLYGWIAYTIYDDILDDEGDPLLLPAANFFLRSLAHIYEAENVTTPGCAALFNYIMNIVDGANIWERHHCRLSNDGKGRLPVFGDYDNLANRSIGHAMGPLAELLIAGYGTDSKEFQNILAMFRHYLIARQLHDDAHDWANDLSRGRVNSVGTLVIKNFQGGHRRHARATITDALPLMREFFWEEVIDVVAQLIDRHIAAARHAREISNLISNTNFMEAPLAALEGGAKNAVSERDDALLFLAHYHPADLSALP